MFHIGEPKLNIDALQQYVARAKLKSYRDEQYES